VLIPVGNARELDELPEEVRRQLRFHIVRSMDEVLALVFRELERPAAAAAVAAGVPLTH
jgi:ATP-dependent Lon protease